MTHYEYVALPLANQITYQGIIKNQALLVLVLMHSWAVFGQSKHDFDSAQAIRIPVIFHVVYSDETANIPESVLQTQLDQLNRDFGGDSDTVSVDPDFKKSIGTARLEFYWSKSHPAITRTQTSTVVFGNADIYYDSLGGKNTVDPGLNLNIWITSLTPGISAWTKNVNENPKEEGIVIDYRYVGNGSGDFGNREEGRTLTHEVGHWLGLSHPWKSGCGDGDGISDTPEQEVSSDSCKTEKVSCGSKDMLQNFMDYSDDACRLFFTSGQVDSMRYFLLEYKPELIENGLTLGSGHEMGRAFYSIAPNPVTSGQNILIKTEKGLDEVMVYNALGNLVYRKKCVTEPLDRIVLEGNMIGGKGLYFVQAFRREQLVFNAKIEKY